MSSLSVLIPARNEEFLALTIETVLNQIRGDSDVIAVLDGYWPVPPIQDHPRVKIIHHTEAVGQRAGVNDAARLSRAKYLMKLDAHCSVDEGFDVKLMEPYESGELNGATTTIPRMYNLHAFDWECCACKHRTYQGPKPIVCEKCQAVDHERVMVWQPRLARRTDFGRFDSAMQFQYWKAYKERPEAQGDLTDVMSSVGACWMMPATRFWQLGGMDEAHGSWGQFGTEIACKSWLSGGRQVVNKRTWFAHLFRTQWGFQWPYPIKQEQIDAARAYSRDLWLHNRWPGQTRPLSWLIDKFAPVPDWNTTCA